MAPEGRAGGDPRPRAARGATPRSPLGAVLAGGGSRRMGASKALLEWDGVPLAAHLAGRLHRVVGDVVVVTRRPEELAGLGLDVAVDEAEAQTPLAGIQAALRVAGDRPVFVVACDMPLFDPAFAERLLGMAEGHDAVVPVHEGRPEPLHAVWMPSALAAVDASVASGHPAPRDVLARLDVRWVEEAEWRQWDPEGRSLSNVNTPEDLARLRADHRPQEEEQGR